MLKNAKLDGFFTNHSLRRSSTTRLFQAGVDKKIIKDFMGHRSDALDKYEVTSEEQRQNISKIIAGELPSKIANVALKPVEKPQEAQLEVIIKNSQSPQKVPMACVCKKEIMNCADRFESNRFDKGYNVYKAWHEDQDKVGNRIFRLNVVEHGQHLKPH